MFLVKTCWRNLRQKWRILRTLMDNTRSVKWSDSKRGLTYRGRGSRPHGKERPYTRAQRKRSKGPTPTERPQCLSPDWAAQRPSEKLHLFVYWLLLFLVKMSDKEKRIEILGMFKRGKKVMEILRELGLPHSTVLKAIKWFNELGTSVDRKGRGRKKTARTPQMIRTIKRKVQRGENNKRKTLNPAWKWSLDIIVNRFWIAFFYHGSRICSR